MAGALPSRTGAWTTPASCRPAGRRSPTTFGLLGYRTTLAGKMHFVGPDQLHGFEERLTTDVYPAGFDWVPDWRLEDRERLPWYHDMSSVHAGRPGARDPADRLRRRGRLPHARALVDAARDPERPFLLVASFTHPHDPYEVPPALLGPLRGRGDRPAGRAGCRRESSTRTAAGCTR